MSTKLDLPELLRLIDERSAAFTAVIAAAPSLDVRVPSCPDWTLADLAQHLGEGRHRWAATVAAGPADSRPEKSEWNTSDAPRDGAELSAWLTEATERLTGVLREAGPDRVCWTWWGDSQSPSTSGAVARHQLQELAVHTYDAQLAVGDPQPLPEVVALDGVDEFLSTCVAVSSPWPHDPAVVEYRTTEGPSWCLRLTADGARADRLPAAADVTAETSASDLVLTFYGRKPVDALKLDGDRRVLDQLVAWEPE
ncbi:maleylpyruvate isomerase family mycothiol-dependent enzyme [Actinoplanes sichuanensis]|uniref:Maleylpyruvate isomerase family mycothiol-dependent enzyme n=1 Tax=Actinoplanes sichuanensis TaxID=512349 RepID=A0ABW4AV40_9ACTN|nr:maleylpyruvate isomerase family mycothiol-dependent enzyme [Actinoplanes sichuanensis]BEL04730.1 maleylpyruvate isomerase family mycothiol-dependent enzyme [Actinoplanes sichuanensis]